MGNKKIELADFKEQANTYYKNLTKNAPHKGMGSHEYIYFSYGIEWAFNHLPQSNYDKLKEDNALLIDVLKEIIELFPNEPKLPISHQVLDISKSALQKVENK